MKPNSRHSQRMPGARSPWLARVLGGALLAGVLAVFGGCRLAQPQTPAGETIELVVADSGAAYPTTAVDPTSGAVYVAYTSKRGSQTDVYLQRLEAGADALQGPVRVNDVAGDAAAHAQAPAQVAVGPDGSVYVAWIAQTPVQGRRFPASDIRLARSTDGGRTFEPAVTVNEDVGFPTSHHFHNLAVGPDSTVYVSWLDGAAQDRARQAREQHGAMRALPAGYEGGHGGHGDDNLPGTQLLVARSMDGGRTFEPGVVVAEGTCQCCRTALSIAPEGTIYVAWRHIFDDQIRDMALSRSSDGGRTFTEPVRVHVDNWQINGCPHTGPAVAVDDQSRVHVIWFTGAEGRSGVYHASSWDGGETFGPATALARDIPTPHVGATSNGSRKGVWLTWDHPVRDNVFVGRITGAELGPVETVPGDAPALASGAKTDVLAWHDGSQIRLRVTRGHGAGSTDPRETG